MSWDPYLFATLFVPFLSFGIGALFSAALRDSQWARWMLKHHVLPYPGHPGDWREKEKAQRQVALMEHALRLGGSKPIPGGGWTVPSIEWFMEHPLEDGK